ncbi:hypothetical protein OHB13_16910 [Streptomyces sp. NBC_00440]|uniref:hypothetical protein n=1 Tax=unclassified Streptomyces TaxID=2593676 RepID=UPI002E233907|nr:hypothetical protein OG760_16260 [Streptomyces sp. NBC_00963]WSX68853.1 hypothetical protein OG221_20815 [Streptomyces sp. NBC_00932]
MGTTLDIVVEFDRAPRAEHLLWQELCAGLPAGTPAPGGSRPHPGTLGVATARSGDGALLGWAPVFTGQDPEAATVEWLLVTRERERIVQGSVAEPAGTGDEEAVLVALFRAAANAARTAGYRALDWLDRGDTGAELDARAAAELEASIHRELGRKWGVSALARWQRPDGLPAVRTRRAPRGTGWQGLELLTADGRTAARIAAVVAGPEVYVERVGHHGVEGPELGSLVADFVEQIREDHPSVESFRVRELDDEVLGVALKSAKLRISERWWQYRLPL